MPPGGQSTSQVGTLPDDEYPSGGSDAADEAVETVISETSRIRSLSAGRAHSCAIHYNRSITCWGNNADGQSDAPDGEFLNVLCQ